MNVKSVKVVHVVPPSRLCHDGVTAAAHTIAAAQNDSADIAANVTSDYREIIKLRPDIVQIHGLWTPSLHRAASLCRRKGIPYVVMPHGMLMHDALSIKWLKKRLARFLYSDRDLRQAAAVVYATEFERDNSLVPNDSTTVIPHPVDHHDITAVAKRREIGFVGRLHPVKRVDMLIEGFAKAAVPDLRLVIIGDGDSAFTESLKQPVDRLGVAGCVEFAGALSPENRDGRVEAMLALCVASRFENFSLAAAEALSLGTPVIAASTTAPAMFDTEAVIPVADNPDAFGQGIAAIAGADAAELGRLGSEGRHYARANFSPGVIANRYLSLYQKIINH